jgi:hypothetical protein
VDVLHALAALPPLMADRETVADVVRSVRDDRHGREA